MCSAVAANSHHRPYDEGQGNFHCKYDGIQDNTIRTMMANGGYG